MKPKVLLHLLLPLVAAPALAQEIAIDHKPVGCIVAGKYPKLNACFTPASRLARSRVYFRAETGGPNWYYVEMKSDQPCFAGILPKPKKDLIGKKVFYYIDAFDQQFAENRTADQGAEVVSSESECKKDIPVAPWVNNASVAVFPSVPAGFALPGLGTGAVVGIAAGGAALVGGGVAIANSGGGDDNTTTSTTPNGGGGGQNTTTTTTTTTTTSTTLTPAGVPFVPSFRVTPDPPTGLAPLRVEFNMCGSQGQNLRFTYDFDGDGVEDFRGPCRVGRTFTLTTVSASATSAPGADPRFITQTYQSKMTVFEVPDNARPPQNSSSETNAIVVLVPAPSTSPSSTTTTTSFFLPAAQRVVAGREGAEQPLSVSSELGVPGGSGQIVVNGRNAAFARRGRSSAMAAARRGENRVEAQLIEASGPGSWRFELAGAPGLRSGSLRVVAGDVALVTGDAIVFRMTGRPGERVVFTFRSN